MNTGLTNAYDRNAGKSRDQLILDNVEYVARILSTLSVSVSNDEGRENLHSAGIVGLVEAANSYDPNRGVAFRTHAYPRIRGAIVDELRKQSPVSQTVLQHIGVVRKAYELMEPPVTPEALAAESGLTLEQVVSCLEAMRFIKPDNWNDLSDVVHESWRTNPDSPGHELEMKEMQRLVAESIESLPEKERLVLTLYYSEELNLSEIGAVLELSESWVSRMLASARFRLQEILRCTTS